MLRHSGSLGALEAAGRRFVHAVRSVLLLGVVACSTDIAVETAQSPTAHFNRYRTYAFEPEGAPSGFAGSAHSAYVKVRLESLTETILESKGYVPAADAPPDMTILVLAGRRKAERWVSDPSSPRFARHGTLREVDIVEGSFVIEVVDTTTGDVLWQGSACLEVEPNTVDEKRLQRAATEVLASLPAR